MRKRRKIIDGKDIVQLLVEAIGTSREGLNLASFSGYAMSRYRLKLFLEAYLSDEAQADLLDALRDEDPFVRCCVVKALGCLVPSIARKPLTLALQDPDENVRTQAALELGNVHMRSAEVVDALLHMLESDTENAKKAAAVSLPIVTGKSFLFGRSDPQKWRSWWQANRHKLTNDR